jgi:hypothetical protein
MISDLDQELLDFVAVQELVLARQAAVLLQISADEATDRFENFRQRGWVTRVALRRELPAAYRITRLGAERVDDALPPLRALDPIRYRHEIGVGWLYAAGRRGGLGDIRAVLTRRQMQAADTTGRSETLLNTAGARFKDEPPNGVQQDARHTYPDLALVEADEGGGWVPLNIVLTIPDPGQLRTTLARGRDDTLIRAQLFLTEDDSGATRNLIETTAADLGLGDRVHVQRLARDGIAGA